MRQKKIKKKLKSVNTVKILGEGVTVPDVRDLNWDTHNIFSHLTRQRVATDFAIRNDEQHQLI